MTTIATLTEGLAMGESARWHDGRFWCSDWVAGDVLTMAVAGDSAGRPDVVTHSMRLRSLLPRNERGPTSS